MMGTGRFSIKPALVGGVEQGEDVFRRDFALDVVAVVEDVAAAGHERRNILAHIGGHFRRRAPGQDMLGIHAAARSEGLGFVPLLEERYDLVTPTSVYESGFLDPLVACLRSERLRRAVRALGGYAPRDTGLASTG